MALAPSRRLGRLRSHRADWRGPCAASWVVSVLTWGAWLLRQMFNVHDRLYIAADTSCRSGTADVAVVHACKSPCHQRAVGYRGSLPSHHPYYLVLRRGHDLFLNLIDPAVPLFKLDSFAEFMSFARDRYDAGGSLLIHCNQGESRAPSLALLFLAKHLSVISGESYTAAHAAFVRLYPSYRPGLGIQRFLDENWPAL